MIHPKSFAIARLNKIFTFTYNKLKCNKLIKRSRNSFYFKFYNSKHIKGKIIFHVKDALLKGCRFNIIGEKNNIILGRSSKLLNVEIYLRGNEHSLTIGENCNIKNTTFWFEDFNCKIKIGSGTTIEGAHIAVTEPMSEIEVGDECMFSKDIDIRNGDSHSIFDLSTHERINYAKNIKIGKKVWLGKYVEILKGVEVGDGSVVAIHSVVTKNVPANTIVAGNPAKVIKSNIYWDRQRVYK